MASFPKVATLQGLSSWTLDSLKDVTAPSVSVFERFSCLMIVYHIRRKRSEKQTTTREEVSEGHGDNASSIPSRTG